MPYHTLRVKRRDDLATITLSRPEKRNAISPEMMAELLTAMDQVENDKTRAAILTGEGKAFCAGMDLNALREMSAKTSAPAGGAQQKGSPHRSEDPALIDDARRMAQLFRRLYAFPKPLIAAVNGHALAGGCGLATLADFTLAVPEAQFGYTEVRIGFMPALVASFLIRQIGEKRARDLLLSGRLVKAEEARGLGLVNEIVPRERLLDRARELGLALAESSPASLAATKRLIVELGREELDRQLEISIQASARMRSTADFREGLAAFLEKRKPQWED
jgi:methylglutaconyl-CoA hydratase